MRLGNNRPHRQSKCTGSSRGIASFGPHKEQVPRGQPEPPPCLDQGGLMDSLCSPGSDIDLLRYSKRVVDINAEVAHRAFDPGVAKEQLDRPEISRSAVDQRDLCSAQRVRPEKAWVQANAGNPSGH